MNNSLLRFTFPGIAALSGMVMIVISPFASARLNANPPETGRLIYISPDGDDLAAGNATSPRRSIQKALDTARPGDVIRLLPGVYVTRVKFMQGGAREHPVTLEGTDGAILDGRETFVPTWKPMPDIAPHVYSSPAPFEPRHVVAAGLVVPLLNERKVGKDSLWKELFRDGIRKRWEGVGALALYRSREKDLLIRFSDNRNPNDVQLDFSPVDSAVASIEADRCVVRNIGIRNAVHGIVIRNSTGAAVEHCRIGRTRNGIMVTTGADRCSIRFNEITLNSAGVNYASTNRREWWSPLAWDLWMAYKTYGFADGRAIHMDRSTGGHRIHDNYIHNHWDGISATGWDAWKSTAKQRMARVEYNRDVDIHHNRIERMNDDALEPNDGGINQRWHHNFIQKARCGLRLKPIDKGPAFFWANQFQGNSEDIRCYGELELNPGMVYVYHNSGTASHAINSNKISGIGTPNYYFLNNLFHAESWWRNFLSDPPNWTGDYNVYVRRGNSPDWVAGKELAQTLHIDPHSRWVDAKSMDSPYVNEGAGDFRLTDGGPARGAGAGSVLLSRITGRQLPGLEEFATHSNLTDAGALPYGAPFIQIPRKREHVEVEPAGFWP
ncbi:MAG: hypothetical protein LBK99_01345 [Opitutaceae bacterium]|jgi:hypothetical protein|nr:hypothetical protein [Opitutaceae bacterium]